MGERMSKNPYDDLEVQAELNVVPLLDLAWNLLIVFIMVVTATVQGINVNLPKASAAAGNIKPATKAITITAEGTIYLDSFPVTLAELEARLKQLKAVNPNFPVVIKGDQKISYKSVIDVLDLLQKLEITQLGPGHAEAGEVNGRNTSHGAGEEETCITNGLDHHECGHPFLLLFSGRLRLSPQQRQGGRKEGVYCEDRPGEANAPG